MKNSLINEIDCGKDHVPAKKKNLTWSLFFWRIISNDTLITRLQELLQPNFPCQGRGQARKWQQISSPAGCSSGDAGGYGNAVPWPSPPSSFSTIVWTPKFSTIALSSFTSTYSFNASPPSIAHGSSVNGKYFTKEWLVDILPLGNNLSKNWI